MTRQNFRLLLAFFFAAVFAGNAQTPSVDDLKFGMDSTTTPYVPKNQNYAYVRSKRGSGGVNTTTSADSIKGMKIKSIVLVFTETSPEQLADREDYNLERWDNLMTTYPEFFQAKTTYKNVCQCSPDGDGDNYKASQGFYIYYDAPAAAAAPAPAKKEEPKPVAKEEPKPAAKEEPKTVAKEQPKAPATEPVKASPPPPTPPPTPASTKADAKKDANDDKEEVETPGKEETITMSDADLPKAKPKKAAVAGKPRKAKDPKACRLPCYEGGDEDLNTFFRNAFTLSKKQKRKFKKATCELKLSINVDGTIKNAQVIGSNQELNEMVKECVKTMNVWNAAVRNGVTVKSDVRIVLKFDAENKCMKPAEIIIMPKLGPKCKCVSDEEMFGS